MPRKPKVKASREVLFRCTATEQCDFHAHGASASAKCPGTCDAAACDADGPHQIGLRGLCDLHAGLTLLARALFDAIDADDAAGKGR